jgi:dipeptidyl aminopeptidase/acylaminoacyl peptidase
MSPDGEVFVDSYSRLDLPPVCVLRTNDGAEIMELERADIPGLRHLGWNPPERFIAKGRDGTTDIYGIVIRPTTFDATRRWPVIDSTYPGPEALWARPRFPAEPEYTSYEFWNAQALAELGFVVVMIDGQGTPYRSRAFREVAYKNLSDGGLPDHIAWIKALARAYPYLDIERVGIYGHSAGGYSSARAVLAHPEFFKVAVSSAGNHDHRIDKASWVERQLGLIDEKLYDEQSNASLAARLEGKLLLVHGDMDENVHIASTLRLVDALIEANKDFDLLILPNRPHMLRFDPYYQRRRWDYFVRHLLDAEPHAYTLGRLTPGVS